MARASARGERGGTTTPAVPSATISCMPVPAETMTGHPDAMASRQTYPSLWESFGYVCLEAMASGCPVIVSAGTGMQEIVADGTAGVVVPPRSPRALARAIVAVLRDQSLRERLRRAGRERAQEGFGFATVAVKQEVEYQTAIKRRRQ